MTFADIVCILVSVIIEVWIFHFYRSEEKTGRVEKVLWLVPILQLLLFLLLFSGGYGTWIRWFYLLVLFSVDLTVCVVLKERKNVREKRKKVSVLYQQREKELAYYEHVTEYLHQMSMIRHEFANQMQVVYDMLENNADGDEIHRMLDQMNENLSRLDPEKTNFDS